MAESTPGITAVIYTCGCEIKEKSGPYIIYCLKHAAVSDLFGACFFPGDYGVLLNLAADIIDDVGHERHRGIATRLREKAKLERAALELATK